MQFTPIDIRSKEFRKAMRGYQCQEVEKFLEAVSKEFESAYTENFELKETVQRLEAELSRYKNLENTLQQTMILAQQTAEDVKQSARREAELLIREAEEENRNKLTETQRKWVEIQDEIQELLRKRELIRTQLKSFLQAQLELAVSYDGVKGIP
ncbi:MAG: DivIVA domain-containing protein [Desulfitobacteriaceae bacterium]